MEKSVRNIIFAICVTLFVVIFYFAFIKEANVAPQAIKGYGITEGSCSEAGSIFMQNDSIKNQIRVIESNAKTKARCFADENAYAFSVKLPSGTFWCIDSAGFSGEITREIKTPSCSN